MFKPGDRVEHIRPHYRLRNTGYVVETPWGCDSERVWVTWHDKTVPFGYSQSELRIL